MPGSMPDSIKTGRHPGRTACVPYIIRSTTDGSVLCYVSVRDLGVTAQGF